jgi:hypothetical protein
MTAISDNDKLKFDVAAGNSELPLSGGTAMSTDHQFTALGPAIIGFQTHGTRIDVGADIAGNEVGVKGACAGPGDGDGVQGFGSGTFSGVAGFGGGNAGTGVFGLGGGKNGPGVRGIGAGGPNTNPSPQAVGVYGQAGSGNADGVQGRGSGSFSGVAGFGDPTNDLGTGIFGLGGGKNGPGVRGIAGGAQNRQSPTGSRVGVYGNGATGVVGESLDPFGVGAQGWGLVGVVGRNTSPMGVAVTGLCQDYQGNTIPNSNAGAFVGNVIIDGNLQVTGTTSAVVPFLDGSHRQLYCLESPESWFEDFGFGQLVKGQTQIQLDPDFAATVNSGSYHVFITEYEDNNALYVTKRTSTGFEVRAKTSTANTTFSYRVVAKRKDIAPARLEKVTWPIESLEAIKKVAKLPDHDI